MLTHIVILERPAFADGVKEEMQTDLLWPPEKRSVHEFFLTVASLSLPLVLFTNVLSVQKLG